jgi:hypothetical protein
MAAVSTYSGKAICITYIQRVFVALVIKQAMRMRHIVICVLPALPHFSTLPYKGTIKKKKLLNRKCVDVLLTAQHLGIILAINQLHTQNLLS